MIQGIYVVFDIVLEESGPVFQAKNDAVAVRQTVQLLLDNPHVTQNDYILYKIGEFENELLTVEPCKKALSFSLELEDRMAEWKITSVKG